MTERELTHVLYEADTLVDVNDTATSGYVCPVPCQRMVNGRIRVWPRPTVRTAPEGQVMALELDLTAWYVTYDVGADPAGVTLPLVAHGQMAVQAAASTFAADVARGAVDPAKPVDIARWSKWWCDNHADARLTDAQETR